jgi:tetratricopeptide (TPR) repeat protein
MPDFGIRRRIKRNEHSSPEPKEQSFKTRLSEDFGLLKSVTLALGGLMGVIFMSFVFLTSILNTETLVEPISVPVTFLDSGYTPEITTARLLDEIAKINEISTTPMPKKGRLSGKRPGDDLVKLQSLPFGGKLDFNSLQTMIQEAFGIKKEKLSGDITIVRSDGKAFYHVRIRSKLASALLVDFKIDASISDVIQQTAVKIVEQMEPVVAASYHNWAKDSASRLRLIDEAIRNDDLSDDNFALADRAWFYVERKKYALAQEDIATIFEADPQFATALCLQSILHRLLNEDRDQSLLFAQRCIESWPNDWHSTLNLAHAYLFSGNQTLAETEMLKAVKLGINVMPELDRVGQYFIAQQKEDQALTVYRTGLKQFPHSALLLMHYGQLLVSKNRFDQANNSFIKAYQIDPTNPAIWLALINEAVNKDKDLRKELEDKLSVYAKSNPESPLTLKFLKLSGLNSGTAPSVVSGTSAN